MSPVTEKLNARKFARVGHYLLPNPCHHRAEHLVEQEDSYNDGGLRIVVHELQCYMCHRVVCRDVASCDVRRKP